MQKIHFEKFILWFDYHVLGPVHEGKIMPSQELRRKKRKELFHGHKRITIHLLGDTAYPFTPLKQFHSGSSNEDYQTRYLPATSFVLLVSSVPQQFRKTSGL